MKKSFLLLFTLLCVSMMGWAVSGSSTDHLDGQPGFTNGYDYSFTTEGTNVIISFTEKENYTGLVAYLWDYTNGFAETGMTVSGHTASITLTNQTPGATLDFACKFAFAGGMSVTKRFVYTVEGGSVDPSAPHASGKGFGTYIAKNVSFYPRVNNKADDTQAAYGTTDLFIVTYGNKMMAKAKLNDSKTFNGAGYSMQIRIWNDGQTGFGEYWAQLREDNNTVALIDMNSNYCNINQGTRTELPINTYMETNAGTGAVPMFMYTLDYINAPIVGDETAPVISSVSASYNPMNNQPTVTISATDANDMFYKIVAPDNSYSYSFSNVIQLTTDESNNVLTYTVYAIDYNGNISSGEDVDVQMKPALSNIAQGKAVTAAVNQSITGRIVDGNFNGDRWSSVGAIHYDPVNHPDDYQDWFYINFVNVYDLSAVRIKWETARPNNYTFRTSIDGSTWTTVATYTEYPANNAITDYILPANTQGRYFGVWATSGYDNLNWGISPYEVEVYGAPAVLDDHNPPTMTSAVLSGDAEWNQVHLAVAGTDQEDGAVVSFHVVDATNSIDQTCVASAGIITVTGLSGETEYAFSVTALDNAGNESASAIVVNVTTPVDTSVPLVAAPAPDATGKDVLPIYSDAFTSILAHPFDKDGWGGVPLMEEKTISGDKCLIYNVASANEVLWGMYDNGNNAIIAADGYHSATGMGIDASAMTHLHIDMWSLQACTNAINININDAPLNTLRLSHNGNGWQSFDIALSEFKEGDEGKKIDNVRWMKFNGIGPISGKMALDNVYFWAPATGMKTVAASSNNTTMGSAVVKQGEDEVTSVAENSEVSFIATPNEGYVFVNWTNLGVEVSTSATYVTTITENTTLVANFDYVRTAYCHTEVLTNDNKKLYLSVSQVGANTYQIRIDGSSEAKINGRNNFNFVVNHTTNYSNAVYDEGTGLGWLVSNEGNGYIVNTFSANDYKALTFGSHYFAIGAQGGGEFILDNNFPAVTTIAWNSTCADAEAPIFTKAEAEILNESSVRLKIQATDNWEGILTYTIARAGAEPIISNHASGEEFAQEVTGLTAGTEYDFTVTVSDGVNNANTHILVTPVGDETKPVMGEASLDSKTWNRAIINVAATDNLGVVAYYVVEKDADYVAAEGKITVEGLTAATAYTFNIKAKDAAGNISDNAAQVSFTTDAHSLVPTVAAPVPTWPAAQVKSIYSDAYALAPANTPNYNAPWWSAPAINLSDIDGDHFMDYNLANDGMIGWQYDQISVALMEKLHIDIFSSGSGTLTIRPIIDGDGALNDNRKQLTLVAQQWNSFDIDLTEFGAHDWTKLFQFSIEYWNAGGLTGEHISVDNVYFYRTTPIVDDENPTNASASVVKTTFFSVKISAQAEDNMGTVNFSVMNGDTEVATGASASGVATTITVNNLTPGTAYNFNVIAKDEADNAADPVAVAASTVALPAPAPTPDLTCKTVVPVFSDAIPGSLAGGTQIHSGGWGESTTAEWIDIVPGDKVFYAQNFNYAGWHSWGSDIDATSMRYLHVDFYSLGMTQISVTPISPGHEGVYNVALTPNAWTSAEIPLSAFDANNIDWADIFQFKFMNPVGGNEFMVDNVYFYEVPDYFRANLTEGGIGTLCLPYNVEAANRQGGTFYRADYQGPGFVYFLEETGTLNAGQAYIFVAEEEAIRLWYSGSEVLTPLVGAEARGFYGTFTDMAAGSLTDKYVIASNKLRRCGAGATLSANRAYIDLTEVPTTPLVINDPANAPVRRRLGVGGNNGAATDLENVFQLNAEGTQKLILNGQLYILRDGHLYNAQGQVVK